MIVIPDFLSHLPVDAATGLPVPYTNQHPYGLINFRENHTDRLIECRSRNLCGVCGLKLTYWIAFLGGPLNVKNRAFTDPPMHERCAMYSLSVCHYFQRPGENKAPTEFAVYITRKYETKRDKDRPGVIWYVPAPAKRIRWPNRPAEFSTGPASKVHPVYGLDSPENLRAAMEQSAKEHRGSLEYLKDR